MRLAPMLVVLLLIADGIAHAQIQRCVREDGSIYFTDTTCPKDATPMHPRQSPQATRPASPRPIPSPAPKKPAATASLPQAHTRPTTPKAPLPALSIPKKDPWLRPDFPAPPPVR